MEGSSENKRNNGQKKKVTWHPDFFPECTNASSPLPESQVDPKDPVAMGADESLFDVTKYCVLKGETELLYYNLELLVQEKKLKVFMRSTQDAIFWEGMRQKDICLVGYLVKQLQPSYLFIMLSRDNYVQLISILKNFYLSEGSEEALSSILTTLFTIQSGQAALYDKLQLEFLGVHDVIDALNQVVGDFNSVQLGIDS